MQDLPLDVRLDDSMAMIPNMKLSAFENVTVIARVSKSGEPTAMSGDAFGQSQSITPSSDAEVDLVIAKIVP